MKLRAWAATTASTTFEFEIPDAELPEDPDELEDHIREAAYNAMPYVNLCHQCARHVDLGDFEIGGEPEDIQVIE